MSARALLERLRASPRISAGVRLELLRYLEQQAAAEAGRAEAAARARAERSRRIREAILTEHGALPLSQPLAVRAGIVARRIGLRLKTYRLNAVPSQQTIRRVLRGLGKKNSTY